MTKFGRPALLAETHDIAGFCSGRAPLDEWLVRRALKNQQSGASRTFVITTDATVVGYYSLAASSVRLSTAPGSVRRNMPDPIPVILLGRLAVDQAYQSQGLGRALLKDAVQRVLMAGEAVGIRALLVHAIDDEAAAFYRHFGFIQSPLDGNTLFYPLDRIRLSRRNV